MSMSGTVSGMNETMRAIKDEVTSQFLTWGQQNWPSTPQGKQPRYMIPAEHTAKVECEKARLNDRMTWAHILVEEVAEACNAESPAHMVEELVQVAAVAVSWIDSIQRNELS